MLAKANHTHFDSFVAKASFAGPHVLIIAGVHGDEVEPMLAAIRLSKTLEGSLKKGRVTIVPVANQSAFARNSRVGEDNLDLARTLPGKKGGSVTEELAYTLSRVIEKVDFLLDLHTGGGLFDILPLTGYLLHPDETILKQQQQMAEAFNLPVIWGTDSQVQGRTLSVARDFRIPAIYAECRGGLSVNKQTVRRYEKGCLRVLAALGMTAPISGSANKVDYWLEDNNPGQGHLQVKLPSPACGIFLPAVSLGRQVTKGKLLGQIVNPLTQIKTSVRAPEDGLVFMLRIPAIVQEGDSLGGILPITQKGKKRIHAS
ncbi:succinylglutamate desuccinylase/aspartoacylase family protein [Flavisolibacter nicotianae]|uniref:succinylglutamate desuccinylase/aspartoacylase family protein n=1 Tax=Flavisolibacter nicotianae TaxID=2364882 RepID=UPI0013C3E95D|nr:succinylglutamate desuccinylase/aspartoacylase family protein [Flavisolibacter nicotianae]